MTPDDPNSVALPVITKGRDGKTIRKSRMSRWRWTVLITVQVAILLHILHWIVTGSTVTPVEPSEAMAFVKNGVVNAGAIFFAAALLSTLVFGRWFCGWGCHLVMLQDGCTVLLKRLGIRPRPFRSRLLLYVPFLLALYMFIWPLVFRFGVAPLSHALHAQWTWIPDYQAVTPGWPGVTTDLVTSDFWETFAGVAIGIPFLAICGFATVYLLGNKGFCTYGCPYGGFFAPLDQYSPGRIRVNDNCEQCGHCTAVCTSNVRVHEEVAAFGVVMDPGCMKCLDCVSVCPNDALSFSFGKPAAIIKPRAKVPAPRFDLTWGGEFAIAGVFAFTFFSVRGIYGLVPMLMAVGIALCVTWLSWTCWKMWRRPNVNLHRFRLRTKGRVSFSGRVVQLGTLLMLVFSAHSAVVQVFAGMADRADRAVLLMRSDVFSASPMRASDEQSVRAEEALRWYDRRDSITHGGIALLAPPDIEIRRAWLHACLGDYVVAEQDFRNHNARFGPADPVCRDISLLLRMQLRPADAEAFGRAIVAEHPTFVTTIDGLAEQLESEGRVDDARVFIAECLARLDDDAVEHRLMLLRRLSLIELNAGRLDEGIRLIWVTIEIQDTLPATWLVLAAAEKQANRPFEAMRALDDAFSRGVETPSMLIMMAELLEEVGRPEEAAEFRQRAAESPSTNKR